MIEHNYGLEYSISFRKVDPNDTQILSEFKCENATIRDFAGYKSIKSKKDVTYLFVDEENKTVIAFCSICCTGISITEYEEDDENKPYNSTIPAIEIDFFAVDERYRSITLDNDSGRYDTLSNALFLYMIEQIKNIASTIVGATHICLYAVPKAKNFYKRCDFVEFYSYMNRDEKPYVKNCIPMFYVLQQSASNTLCSQLYTQ